MESGWMESGCEEWRVARFRISHISQAGHDAAICSRVLTVLRYSWCVKLELL